MRNTDTLSGPTAQDTATKTYHLDEIQSLEHSYRPVFARGVGCDLPTELVSKLQSPGPKRSLHYYLARLTLPRTARSGVWRADEHGRLVTKKEALQA